VGSSVAAVLARLTLAPGSPSGAGMGVCQGM
jgi:hypothetical protein